VASCAVGHVATAVVVGMAWLLADVSVLHLIAAVSMVAIVRRLLDGE